MNNAAKTLPEPTTPTVKVRGIAVASKFSKCLNRHIGIGYTNVTQAQKKCDKAGPGWYVVQIGRPFFAACPSNQA